MLILCIVTQAYNILELSAQLLLVQALKFKTYQTHDGFWGLDLNKI